MTLDALKISYRKPLDQAKRDEVCRLFDEGLSLRAIASTTHIDNRHISDILSALGKDVEGRAKNAKRRKLMRASNENLAKHYEAISKDMDNFVGCCVIVKRYGVTRTVVYEEFERRGIDKKEYAREAKHRARQERAERERAEKGIEKVVKMSSYVSESMSGDGLSLEWLSKPWRSAA